MIFKNLTNDDGRSARGLLEDVRPESAREGGWAVTNEWKDPLFYAVLAVIYPVYFAVELGFFFLAFWVLERNLLLGFVVALAPVLGLLLERPLRRLRKVRTRA